MNRVLCYGGRFFSDAPAVDAALSLLLASWGPFLIIHGAARGADSLCGAWGLAHGLPTIAMAAPWAFCEARGDKRAAGSMRNQWMLQYAFPTHGVEFPGNTGTRDMRRRLTDCAVPVWSPYQS